MTGVQGLARGRQSMGCQEGWAARSPERRGWGRGHWAVAWGVGGCLDPRGSGRKAHRSLASRTAKQTISVEPGHTRDRNGGILYLWH